LETNYLAALLLGLFSTIHCVGMCGGIAGILTFSLPAQIRAEPVRLGGFVFAYSLGRILSYSLAGGLAALFGSELVLRLWPDSGNEILRISAALLLILAGLHLAGWFPGLRRLEQLGNPLWRRLEPVGRRLLPVNSPLQAVAYGMVWGWLPCGMVYTALTLALTRQGFWAGALWMAMFGLGTLPGVTLTGVLAEQLRAWSRNTRARRAFGVILIMFALLSLTYGAGLLGVANEGSR